MAGSLPANVAHENRVQFTEMDYLRHERDVHIPVPEELCDIRRP